MPTNSLAYSARSTIMPVLRRSVLVRLEPPPTDDEAQAILQALKASWPQRAEEYLQLVAETAQLDSGKLSFVAWEEVRVRRDGKTPMVDFPRLRTPPGYEQPLDTRICIAICTDNLSSKVWSRVGLPMGHGSLTPLAVEDLEKLSRLFRTISKKASMWAYRMLQEVLQETFSEIEQAYNGELEVSAFGADDNNLAPAFRRLAESDATAAVFLRDQEAGKYLKPYFSEALGQGVRSSRSRIPRG